MRNLLLQKTARLRAQRGQNRGFSLVEVLVAIVVLSIGVLGAVGLQAASLQASKEVRHQALAGSMAKELAEKMRGNNTVAIAANNPYLIDVVLPPRTTPPTSLPKPSGFVDCSTTLCNTTQIANFDVWDWQSRMRDALPSPRVTVCMDETPFDSSGIPQWACTNTGDVAVLKLAWNRTDTKGELQLTSVNGTSTLPLLVLPVTAGSSQ